MTLYARSDLAYVIVPVSSGGCGSPHRRPVENGAPAKLWGLECPGRCEEFLRKTDASGHQWSATMSELPETYDEKHAREDFEKRGAKDRDQVLALALARLAGVELPESLVRPLTGNMPHIPAAPMLCPDGHANPAGQKFCGHCGAPMHTAEKAIEAPQDNAGDDPDMDLERLHWKTLQKLCRDRGLAEEGSKADLLARLREPQPAGVAA
jgi:hypothetical protein